MKAFNIDPRAKIYVYDGPISMACGFPKLTELAGKVNERYKKENLFLFLNKKANYLKVLYYYKGGYCIFSKKLDLGKYDRLKPGQIEIHQLESLINNVIVHGAKRVRKELKAA